MKKYKALFPVILAGVAWSTLIAQDKIEIRPSVWGTDKWYGGYEIYRMRKLDYEIRPAVWGSKAWPGGYEIYKEGRMISEAKASTWGQEKWYGGYEVNTADKHGAEIVKVLQNEHRK
jgi:hypothetical protein